MWTMLELMLTYVQWIVQSRCMIMIVMSDDDDDHDDHDDGDVQVLCKVGTIAG